MITVFRSVKLSRYSLAVPTNEYEGIIQVCCKVYHIFKAVSEPIDYLYSSARDYYEMGNDLLEVDLIDFGVQEGYVF